MEPFIAHDKKSLLENIAGHIEGRKAEIAALEEVVGQLGRCAEGTGGRSPGRWGSEPGGDPVTSRSLRGQSEAGADCVGVGFRAADGVGCDVVGSR